MINPDELEEPVPPLSHLLFDEVTALRQEIVLIRDQRDNVDAVQAIQIAAAKQALQDVTEGVAEMEIEIARLRAELKTSNAERDELRQQVENIKNGFEGGCYLCEVVGEMNKRLQKERDEARRQVCDWYNTDASGCVKSGSEETAIERGWDCFKNQETL